MNAESWMAGSANESEVCQGLYVSEGLIIPAPLGVNPLLIISALSERIADRIIAELQA